MGWLRKWGSDSHALEVDVTGALLESVKVSGTFAVYGRDAFLSKCFLLTSQDLY